MRLEQIATQLLCDLEATPSASSIAQRDIKIELIKDAILAYHSPEDTSEDRQWKTEQFKIFWDKYQKKVALTTCHTKWMKLKRADIEKILETVDFFVRATPDVQYRPNPLTYINQRRWTDELPQTQKSNVASNFKANTWQY